MGMADRNLKCIKVSAPGKIILHGEHAVVYEKTAIALSLGLRTRLELRETTDRLVSISMERFFRQITWNAEELTGLLASTDVNTETPEQEVDENLLGLLRNLVAHVQEIPYANGDGPDAHIPGVHAERMKRDPSTQSVALMGFLYALLKISKLAGRTAVPSLSFTINSEIAISAGLGSSAAFAVTVCASILSYVGLIDCQAWAGRVPQPEQLAIINHWAFLVEKIIHGKASGIDNAVSTYGGVIKFTKGEMTRVPSRLKLDVVVVDTGVQRNTKTLVENVRRRKKLYPRIVDPILDSIDGISDTSYKILQHGNGSPTVEEYEVLSELISINQNLLNALGVGHPGLDAICRTASKWGQAAKLTGAGGGGCAIVVLDPDILKFEHLRESMMADFRKLEFKPQTAELGGPGVLFHHAS